MIDIHNNQPHKLKKIHALYPLSNQVFKKEVWARTGWGSGFCLSEEHHEISLCSKYLEVKRLQNLINMEGLGGMSNNATQALSEGYRMAYTTDDL